jgi:threonine aldolase
METPKPIDLRSDTVTRPGPEMRRAMAEAEVGDDVFGDDPTVQRLQERVAKLLGKQAALFVPSGTQANQIALLVHARPGDQVLVGEGAHLMAYESGAASAIAGVQLEVLGTGGMFDAADVEEAVNALDTQLPPTRLVCVEDTHNRAGGRVWPIERVRAVCAAARAQKLLLHLDGARLLNAAVASGASAKEIAAPFDTVSMCLSKGLGAPVGSLLAGTADMIARAQRYRRMLGGGMRQAGVLAAAGLWALEHNVERLAEDHANARRFAELLRGTPGLVVDDVIDTNIVMIDVVPPAPPLGMVFGQAYMAGVLLTPVGSKRLRAVTHLDVDRAACERAAEILIAAARG